MSNASSITDHTYLLKKVNSTSINSMHSESFIKCVDNVADVTLFEKLKFIKKIIFKTVMILVLSNSVF